MNVEQVETAVRAWLAWTEKQSTPPRMAQAVRQAAATAKSRKSPSTVVGISLEVTHVPTSNLDRAWMRDVVLGREAVEGVVCVERPGGTRWVTTHGEDDPRRVCGYCGVTWDGISALPEHHRIGATAGRPGLLVVAESHDGFTLHHVACHDGCTPHKMDSRFSDCRATGYVLNEQFAGLVEHGEDDAACGFVLKRIAEFADRKTYRAIRDIAYANDLDLGSTLAAVSDYVGVAA